LEKAVNKGHLIGNIVDNWLRLAGGRTTIAFAGSVAHSKAIRDAFVMVGVKAEHLDGETPDEERKAILERLANGTTTLVANYGILVEGVDIPPAKCAILARPTKSRVCYMQSAGRVLRPWNGMVPLILDHAGCTDRFDIIGVDVQWSLTEKAKRSPHVPSHRNCPQCFAYVLSTLRQCPHCGTEMPTAPPTSPKDKKMIPVDLALRSVTDVPTAEYAWTQATVRTARNRGWHPKAIQHRFLETFGHPIPESLKSAISQDYKRDEEWKQRRRERRNVTEPSQDQTRTCSKQN
jgi:superfamily II DNA or RNA helicase